MEEPSYYYYYYYCYYHHHRYLNQFTSISINFMSFFYKKTILISHTIAQNPFTIFGNEKGQSQRPKTQDTATPTQHKHYGWKPHILLVTKRNHAQPNYLRYLFLCFKNIF